MAYQIPEKLKKLAPYDPITKVYPIRLDSNESFLPLPSSIKKELTEAVGKVELNRYPDPYARELCRKAGAFFGVAPESMTAGNGSDELIGLILSNFLEPGDSMLVALPDFSMYDFYAQMNGVRVVDALEVCWENPERPFAFSADLLIQAAKESQAKLLIFSNPCNPTSLGLCAKEVEKVIEALPEVLIVVDEAYMDFTGGSVLSKVPAYDHVVLLKTCSKAFGMAGIRLGFAVAGPDITRALQAVKSPYNVNSMTQAVGCVLFDHPVYLMDCIEDIKNSRDELYEGLIALKGKKTEIEIILPTETNFVFFKTARPREIYEGLLENGISIRYMKDFLRISAGSKEENEAVLKALEALIQ